jgi:hypothetical protein
MNTRHFFGAAVLGLAISFSAHAQAPTSAATTGPVASPGTGLPTAMPPGEVPANATTPMGTSGQLYPNGVPDRNLNGATQRADQPVGGSPAVTGSQPTRTLNKRRTNTPRL